jgi:hypothetical protein
MWFIIPHQDRFFISGCVDRRLRVWDIIPDANIKEYVSLSEKVSSGAEIVDVQLSFIRCSVTL